MNYYKVVKDSVIVGACSEYDFRRYQEKHKQIIVSDRDHVEAIQYGEILYHDIWMADSEYLQYIWADVTEITEEEYASLIEQLDDGETPEDGSLDEEIVMPPDPETPQEETVRKTAAQILRDEMMLAARYAEV